MRVSTTVPQARVMKLAAGGFRPASNCASATATAHRLSVGVDVTNAGCDTAELAPMLPQEQARCGRLPVVWLVDGGFVSQAAFANGVAPGWPWRRRRQPQDPTRASAQPKLLTGGTPPRSVAPGARPATGLAALGLRGCSPPSHCSARARGGAPRPLRRHTRAAPPSRP